MDSSSTTTTTTSVLLEKSREVYSLTSVLSNTYVYLGVSAAMLAAFVIVNAWPRLASCLVPRWFNSSLPLPWITGWSSPTKEQVVDILLGSDFGSNEARADGKHSGREGKLRESARETALRGPPKLYADDNGDHSDGRRVHKLGAASATTTSNSVDRGVSAFTGRRCCKCPCGPGRNSRRQPRACGFFAWMWVPWTISEVEFVERVGLDGYLLFRTMRLVLLMSGVLCAVSLFGLAPAYASLSHPCPALAGSEAAQHGANAWIWGEPGSCNVSFVYANNVTCTCGFFATVGLDVGSQYYLHEVIATLVGLFFTAVQLWLLAGEAKHWMRVRLAYAETAPPEIYSVMLRYVPRSLRSEVRLRRLCDEMYPGQVHSVTLTPGPAAQLGPLVQRLDDVERKITREQTINEAYRKVEERTKVPCVHCRRPEKSMAILQRHLRRLTQQVRERRERYTAACALHIQRELLLLRGDGDGDGGSGSGNNTGRDSFKSGSASDADADDDDANADAAADTDTRDDFGEAIDALYWEWTERKRRELSQAASASQSSSSRVSSAASPSSASTSRPVTAITDTDKTSPVSNGSAADEIHIALPVSGSGGDDGDDGDDDDVSGDALEDLVRARGYDDFEEDHTKLYENVAFVTFRTAAAAGRALQLGRHAPGFPKRSAMRILAARQPRDVRWADLSSHKARWELPVDAFVWLMFVVILVGWGFVVFMIGLYTTPEALGCLLSPNCTDDEDVELSLFWASVLAFISPLFLQGLSAFLKQVIGLLVGMRFVAYNSSR